MRFHSRAASLMCVLGIHTLVLQGRVVGQAQGAWAGPWNWSCVLPAPCGGFAEISHAAVIPNGVYKGKVMFWHQAFDASCTPTFAADAWIFDPLNPKVITRVSGQLDADVLCSGMSWNSRGELIIAGANRGMTPNQLQQTYRFRPGLIGGVVSWEAGECMPELNSTGVWERTGDMIVPRFYPTLVALSKKSLQFATGTLPINGGSHLIIGGDSTSSTNDGSIWWEFLQYGSVTLASTVGSTTTTMPPTAPSVGAPSVELYAQIGTPAYPLANPPIPAMPADPDVSSYPKAFQLSNSDILIAFDLSAPLNPPNPVKETWVLKLYETPTAGGSHFELWRGDPDPNFLPLVDRNYGGAVLIHQRLPTIRNDRVIVFGGGEHLGGGALASNSVQEFEPNPVAGGAGTGGPVVKGDWRTKPNMLSGRDQSTPILLPTRQILLIGGTLQIHDSSATQLTALTQPELYDPGDVPGGGSSALMAQSNPVPAGGGLYPTARMYHHIAVLLPDGSVFIAGGDFNGTTSASYPFAEGEFSGEIFQPPYLTTGLSRPFIQTTGTQLLMSTTTAPNTFECIVANAPDNVWDFDRVVLTRPAADTHFFDADQRYIELECTSHEVSDDTWTLQVTGLPDNLGPAGFYMLWVVMKSHDGTRVPTPSEFVHFR